MSDLPEIIVSEENVEYPDQEKVIMNIFTLCDIEKTGAVRVSKLIEFMSPYIDFNSAHLEELRIYLDPKHEDPCITSSVFFKSMKEWTDKFKNEFNCTPTEIVDTNSKRLSDIALRQSTPTKNYPKSFFKGEYESGILNLSNISTYSCHTGAVVVPVDPNALQEQINELEYQNKKLNDLLSDVKLQLNGSEEQNSLLQSDLDRVTKRLQAEQKINEHLQNERKVIDEYRENANSMMKKYELGNQNLSSCKKENAQLKNQITESKNENKKLQESLTNGRNNDAKKNQIIEELKIEIEVREKEILALEECKRQLNEVCAEKEDGIRHLIDETQHLQYQNKVLEKRFLDALSRSKANVQPENLNESGKRSLSNIPVKLKHNYSNLPSASTPFSPNANQKSMQFFTFDSPVTRSINNKSTLNSPKLLKMLANPISPIQAFTPTIIPRFRRSGNDTITLKENCSIGTDGSSEYFSPSQDGNKDCSPTSENTVISVSSDESNKVLIKSKDRVGISVKMDEENFIVCSLKTPKKSRTSLEKECQISPSSCEKFTQTPPRRLQMNLNSSLGGTPKISSPSGILSKSINGPPCTKQTPMKPVKLSLSNPNMKFNLSASLDPKSSPSKLISKSLSPNISCEEDCYWDDVVPIVQPHESLQSELMQASSVGCVGSCDHKIKLTQYEQEIESLQCELKQHENCQNIIEKYESEMKELKGTIEKYETNMKILQEKLNQAKSDIKRLNMQEKILEATKENVKELEEKFINAQMEKEKEIAVLKSKEEELRKEYEKKNMELKDVKRGVDKFAEKVDICKMDLQRAMCDKLMYEAELKTVNEECEKFEKKCHTMEGNIEELIKNMEEQDKEKVEMIKNMEVKEREKEELFVSNKNLSEQMSLYKENFLLAQEQVSSLNEEYSKQKEEFEEMKKQFAHLNLEYENLSSNYKANEGKLKEMEATNEDGILYKDSYLTAQNELLNLKTGRENLKQDLEIKAKQLETLQKELIELTILNEENENKLQESNTEIEDNLNKLQAEYETKIKEMNNEQEKKMKEFDWLIIEKSELEDSLEKYKKKYSCAKERLVQVDDLRTCYNETLAKLKVKENDMSRLEEDIEENLAHISDLETTLEKARLEWTNQESELEEKITVKEKEMSVIQENLEKAKEELSKTLTCKNCSDLEVEKKSKTKPETKRTTRVELLYHKIEKLDSQLDEEQNKTKTLASNLANVANEKTKLETKLAELNNQMKELVLQKELGQSKIKKLSHNVDALELKLQTYKMTIAEVNTKVTDTTTDLARTELKYNDLQVKSSRMNQAHTLMVTHVSVVRQKINDQKQILGGNTLHAVNVWRTMLENVSPTSPILKQDSSGLVSTTTDSTSGPLDEEIHNLEQQINLTCILLKTLAKLRDQFQTPTGTCSNSPTHLESSFRIEHSVETRNQSVLSEVVKKKFVLKPATFIFRTNPLNTSPMSPDSPAAEMAEESSPKEYVSPRVELNNNDILVEDVKLRSTEGRKCESDGNRKSFASDITDSGSTSDSASSESNGIEVVAKRYVNSQERMSAGESKIENEMQVQEGLARQFRSMSEGAIVTHQLTADGDVSVFPNLRDNVLETLGLLPNGQPKERLSDEEIEDKFKTLTLAFAIDAVTLADRHERQRRQRDQAEDNMVTEVTRFTQAIHRLNPLCVDAETTEMVTSLLSLLDVILQASNRISTSAEVFGSVQQEWQLAESVNVMLSHLRNLRQQRDTARRQLQCTKRMLQESTSSTETTNSNSRQRLPTSNGRVVTRRRASIATITRPLESPRGSPGTTGCTAALVDGVTARRVTTRRTSAAVSGELSSRQWDSRVRQEWSPMDRAAIMVRSARPSRLELGLDLVKIKEGPVESSTSDSFEKYESDTEFRTATTNSEDDVLESEVSVSEPTTIQGYIRKKLLAFGAQIEVFWNYLVEEGTIHEICCLGAIICFALCTIIMGNLLLEMEYSRRGIAVRRTPWHWLSWNEFLTLMFEEMRSHGEKPM